MQLVYSHAELQKSTVWLDIDSQLSKQMQLSLLTDAKMLCYFLLRICNHNMV